MTQKRPRIMAASQAAMAMSPISPGASSIGHVPSPSSGSFHQHMQDPGSYLYAPLANQPPPFLVPVRQQAQNSTSNVTGAGQAADRSTQLQQGQQDQGAHPSQQAAAALAVQRGGGADNSRNMVKQEEANERTNAAALAAQSTVGQGQNASQAQRQTQQQTSQQGPQSAAISVATQAADLTQVNPNSVEGLSFSDDFRDPFMGFLEVD